MYKALTLLLILLLAQNQTPEEQSAEKELDRRLGLITDVVGKLKRQLRSENPQWSCSGERKTRYGSVSISLGCFLEQQAFHIDIKHYSSSDEAAADLKLNLQHPNYSAWREIGGLGEQAIVTDGCERTWLRFRKGQFFIYINGNVNDEAALAKSASSSEKLCEQEPDAISVQLSETASRVARAIDESIPAS